MKAQKNIVTIVNHTKAKIPVRALTLWVQKVREELKSRNIRPRLLQKHLTIAFVSERKMRILNKKFRKKTGLTDILSFSPVEKDSLGELALCLPVVYHKKLEGFSDRRWLCYLVLHGILHLLGFEHEQGGKTAQKMYRLEEAVFTKLTGVDKFDNLRARS